MQRPATPLSSSAAEDPARGIWHCASCCDAFWGDGELGGRAEAGEVSPGAKICISCCPWARAEQRRALKGRRGPAALAKTQTSDFGAAVASIPIF